MSRPRLRPPFAACTCSWRTTLSAAAPSQSAYATLSAPPPAQPEPFLDFLYPTFGFFSRSLPSSRSPSSTSPSHPPIPPSDVDLITGVAAEAGRGAGTWRRGFGAVAKCVCGRPRQSCLRCRAASTSAAARVATAEEREIGDEDLEPLEVLQGERVFAPPAPPPPLATGESSGSGGAGGGAQAGMSPAEVLAKRVDRSLTDAEFIQQVRRNLYKGTSHYAKSISPVAPAPGSKKDALRRLPRPDALEATLEQLWQDGQRLMEIKGEGLTPKERGDFIHRFSLLARAPRRVVNDPLEERTQVERWKQLQRRAGWYMKKMLESMSVVSDNSHGRHEPALWIDAMALQGRLDSLPFTPPTACPSIDDEPFLNRLYVLFLRPTHSVEERTRVETIRRSTLAILLETWLRTDEGSADAVRFMCGWGMQRVMEEVGEGVKQRKRVESFQLVLRRRYGEVVARLHPSPSEWFEQTTINTLEAPVIGPHLVTALATTGSPLAALRVWRLLESRGRTAKTGAVLEVRMLSDLLEGLSQSRLMQDARLVAEDLDLLARSFLPARAPRISSSSYSPSTDGPPVESLSPPNDSPAVARPSSSSAAAAAVPPSVRPHLIRAFRLIAQLAALQARHRPMESALAQLRRLGWVDPVEEAARRMRAASLRNNIGKVRDIFDAAIAQSGESQEAQARLTGVLVGAHVQMDDMEGATKAFENLLEQGVKPSVYLVNSLLSGHAARNDVDATYDLFQRLARGELGPVPNVDSYNALVVAHCNLRDVDSAEGVVLRMKQSGIAPVLRVWTTLMNAYVELGDWQRTLSVYSLLEKSRDTLLRPDTAAVNVMLKAAVLTSTPSHTVLKLFRRALAHGLRPNSSTYTLVMQSVSSAGLMDVAEELFAMMDAPIGSNALPLAMTPAKPDIFTFSTLISGYIKAGQMVKARACLAEMRRRGIEPSSITYGIIVSSFLHEQTKRGAKKASKFAMDFLNDSPLEHVRHRQSARLDRHLARGDELLNVFAPILKHQAKQGQADLALITFKLILDGGAHPSIELYTTLMDAYQRGDDVVESAKNVETVWRGLHQSVLDAFGGEVPAEQSTAFPPPTPDASSSPSPTTTPLYRISPSHANTLRLPLSILIHSLDRAGRRDAIHEAWTTLAREGFSFDAGNWNALARHLARDQQLERACWILHHVLMDPDVIAGNEQAVAVKTSELESVARTAGTSSLGTATRTPSRLKDWREAERHAYRKEPISVEKLLGVTLEGEEEQLSLVDAVGQAQVSKRRQCWFPHSATLKELDSALDASMVGGKGIELEQKLRGSYPRAFEALHRWRKQTGRKEVVA